MISGAIESHVIHLNGLVILLLFEEDVAHVDSESASLRILLILKNDGVTVESFSVQSVSVVHISQIVKHVEGQVNVNLIQSSLCFA